MVDFFTFAATAIGKLTASIGGKALGEKIKEIRTQRRMERMVDDAVDRIVDQIDGFLKGENVSEDRKEILIASLCANLQPLVDDPQKFFAGNLDGSIIFKQCHPQGKLPEEIREEDLGHFYTVLFPQIAHFLAGSRIALQQWQAEGYREEFKRLTQIAEEIRAMNVKVADLPTAVTNAFGSKADKEAETLLREFSQTLLNNLLLRLDLSPLRAERALHGSLREHFVIPAFRERREKAKPITDEKAIIEALAMPGVRRIVHGGAGLGKTTWSLWLQSRLLESEFARIAVVLRLREIPNIEKHSLLDLLRERAGVHLRDALTDKVLRKWNENGRLVVILDGFDEVPEDRRDLVEKWIKSLGAAAKKTSIIVTSRPLQSGHLEALKKNWQQWDLLAFDESRIIEFMERWHRYLPEGELSAAARKVDARALAHTFLSDPSLRPLADTPLMLGTLLFVHHRDKKLPSGRVDLYERYIAAMLGLRDSGMGVQARATKLTDKDKRRVLAHIALHFHSKRVDQVNDETMHQLVDEALEIFKFDEKVERLLPALCERTGLLQGPGAWSFMHKTIGEFLVAELVCDGTTCLPDKRRLDRKELWTHRHKDNWTSIMFFWAGKTSLRELEEFIADLIDEDKPQAVLLALSLLHDQGDRLLHEIQRTFALKIVQREWLLESDSRLPQYGRITPNVPSFAYSSIDGLKFNLRGLRFQSISTVLEDLFERRILTASDIKISHKDIHQTLLVSAINSRKTSQTKWMQDLRQDIDLLPLRDLALHCFFEMFFSCETQESIRDGLADWQKTFPEGRNWLSILLICALNTANDRQSKYSFLLGQLLHERRLEPIDHEWLRGSAFCRSFARDTDKDMLHAFQALLGRTKAIEWNITAQQHTELTAWCDLLIAQRVTSKENYK